MCKAGAYLVKTWGHGILDIPCFFPLRLLTVDDDKKNLTLNGMMMAEEELGL